jgi:polyisoprenoid-binding protein YceI
VIGATDQVAGDIIVDFDNPAASQVGELRINVRTIHTDSELRDRAIRTEILESRLDEYEFVSFVPTAITGLPDAISLDEEVGFQVTGDFTVRAITQSVTFDMTATMVTEERLDGVGTANITRDMYGLTIPDAPGVANVSNEITLEIEFTARMVDE